MRSQALFALLATWAWSTAAAPAAEQAPRPSRPGLRLIKTSPEDHGKWVTEEQKIEFRTKSINFIDITDITVCLVPGENRVLSPRSPDSQTIG
jgi:hypothetical protein